MYKVTFLCSLISKENSNFNQNLKHASNFDNLFKFKNLTDRFFSSLFYYKFFLAYALNSSESYFVTAFGNYQKTFFLKKTHLNNLNNFLVESHLTPQLLKIKNGNFFFKNMNFGYLRFLTTTYKEFALLDYEIKEHLNSSK